MFVTSICLRKVWVKSSFQRYNTKGFWTNSLLCNCVHGFEECHQSSFRPFVMHKALHYSDVTWLSWCLKSPVTWFFVQKLVEANNMENTKAPHHWPFVMRTRNHWNCSILRNFAQKILNRLIFFPQAWISEPFQLSTISYWPGSGLLTLGPHNKRRCRRGTSPKHDDYCPTGGRQHPSLQDLT